MTPSRTAVHKPWPGLIEAYRDRLPIGDDWAPVTLLEGGTPLIHAKRISEGEQAMLDQVRQAVTD